MNEAALENTDGLADTEIARLITLSNKARYERSDVLPVSAHSPFEPKSLVEIAMAAQKRRDEANAIAAAKKAVDEQTATDHTASHQTAMSEQDTAEAPTDNSDTAAVTAESADVATMDVSAETQPQSENRADQSDDGATNIASEGTTSDPVPDAQTAQQTDTQNEQAAQVSPAPVAPSAPDASVLEAEYKRGQEAGLAEGQAKAAEQLEKVLQSFEQAVLSLTNPEALDVSALSAQIASRVMALASDRAGQTITDMPEAFAKRIETLITMVKSETASPTINLNKEDFAAIKSLAKNRDKLKGCNFVVDETMTRGDVRVAVGGVGLVDQISNRTKIQITEDEKTADTKHETESTDTPVIAQKDESDQATSNADSLTDGGPDETSIADAKDNGKSITTSAKDETEEPAIDDDAVSGSKTSEAEDANNTDDSVT
ncbi:FliH/SctL family protein [Candidatus Puniceispirillum sp.]|jgi:flagellar assembly protein FliH|uniref:FliH/SctL family protein n=2 Tax=Candidatus Puniceispirillum TaxID=767891 RepID=UPI001ED566B7|nr:hypothetical protein [Candidatus Puniceispirillum sp.]MBT6566518.1 hypothetical protein [Candidatus Puniceispirillum sp.]